MMTREEFRSEIARMRFIDHSAVPQLTDAEWQNFRDNPWRFFISCSEHHQRIIWRAMERDREDQRKPK